jgi:ABC-2 type transport system permease protein
MFINRFFQLAARELKIVWSDWRLTVIVFLMPIVYTLLLGYLYLPMRVLKIPTYIIDKDKSSLSREITEAVKQSEYINVVKYVNSVDEFRRANLAREAYIAIEIPAGFERDIKKGKRVKVLGLIDGSNLLISNTGYKVVAGIAGTYSAGVEMKKLRMKGTPGEHVLTAAMPIDTGVRTWYNPAYTYMDFIMPGVIGAVIQQIVLLGVALAFAKERKHGLVPTVFKITSSPLEVLASKAILYTAINMVNSFAAFSLIFKLFGVRMFGSFFLMELILFTFIVTICALGITVSVICKDETFATEILMLLSLPSFLLSGYTWPQFSMIPIIKDISYCLPLTHFVLPIRTVVAQNGNFSMIRGDMYWMWTLATVSYVVAYFVLRHVMAAAKKELKDN